MKILIVEDEFRLADVIASRLKKEKYSVDISHTGTEGLAHALTGVYSLVILDVMLPGMNGFQILKEIRESKTEVKVIMLTAKSSLEDKLNGFETGADDYLTKPFHIEELVARVNVQLRKNDGNRISDCIEVGNLKLNLKTSELTCTETGETMEISGKEFMLLEYLMQNKGLVLSRDQIYDRIWGIDCDIESNNLEAYLSFIRKKIKIIGSDVAIKAIRGLGYKLEINNEKIKK